MKNIKFVCTKCGSDVTAPGSLSGRGIRCPNCQERLVVPAADGSPAPASGAAMAPAPVAKPADGGTPAPTPAPVSSAARPAESGTADGAPSSPESDEGGKLRIQWNRTVGEGSPLCPVCRHPLEQEGSPCEACGYIETGRKAETKVEGASDRPAVFQPALRRRRKKTNTAGILLVLVLAAAAGGGGYYVLAHKKNAAGPKPSATATTLTAAQRDAIATETRQKVDLESPVIQLGDVTELRLRTGRIVKGRITELKADLIQIHEKDYGPMKIQTADLDDATRARCDEKFRPVFIQSQIEAAFKKASGS